MRRLLLATASLLVSAQFAFSFPAIADYKAAEAALQAGDLATAMPLLAEEARLGNPVAAFNLAKIYEDGAAGSKDYAQAAAYYHIAGEIDTAPRYNGAALGPQAPQLIAAAQMYGQYALGRLYETGNGVPQDSLEAIAWFTRSADLGNEKAMLKLSVIHRDGLPGVPPDPAASVAWLRRAAELGSIAAMNELGRAYLSGSGVVPNAMEAAGWFEKAAAGGSAVAEYNLGLIYKTGFGGQPDLVRAAKHFERGANAKDAASMLELGHLYAGGQGLPQDKGMAHAWYSLAADYGIAEGLARAQQLAATMTPGEQAKATAFHDSWRPVDLRQAEPPLAQPDGLQPETPAAPAPPTAGVVLPATPAPDLPPLFEENVPAATGSADPVPLPAAPVLVVTEPVLPAAVEDLAPVAPVLPVPVAPSVQPSYLLPSAATPGTIPAGLPPSPDPPASAATAPLPRSTPSSVPPEAVTLPGAPQPGAKPFSP
jgi:hypothetical protein